MRKLPKKELRFKGEITAFLSLIFILLLSVVGALIESTSIQMTRDRKRADTSIALESVFAEYHREMLEAYDLFVRYGCNEGVLQSRLAYYGADQMTHRVAKRELLTDDNGGPFYKQAVRYAKDWLGMEGNDTSQEGSGQGNMNFSQGSVDVDREEANFSSQLEGLLEEEEAELPEENNPIQSVRKLKQTGLLSLVISDEQDISERRIHTQTLPTHRTLEEGNYKETSAGGAADKFFFLAYLTEHFGTKTDTKETRGLLYEQEYLLEGHESDKENLEAVCRKILKIRMAANYVYLQTDTTKQAEAETMALGLCSLLTVPGITQIVKQGILLAWAYGESIVDLRVLLKGKKVAAVKTGDTWQLQLSNLVNLGTDQEVVGEKDSLAGLSYEDYVKGLLLIEDKETLCMRGLDLIESNLNIRTDQCMIKVHIKTHLQLRRGIEETFHTEFAYR